MFKSLKKLLGLSLLAFFGVWMGCSSDSSPVSPSNKAVTDDDGSATQVSTFTVSTEVSIPDDSLRVAVTQKLWDLVAEGKLDIPTGTNPLTTANLAEIETLTANRKGIRSLVGLENATNLKSLNLRWNLIEDLAPLAGLTKLTSLNVDENRIRGGYSHLASLTKLTELLIGGSENADIGSDTLEVVVENMRDLENLKVNTLGLTDISFLEKLTELRIVNLNSNKGITDFKPLTCLPNLSLLLVKNIPAVYDLPIGHDRTVEVDTGHDPFIQYLIDDGITVRRAPYAGGQ